MSASDLTEIRKCRALLGGGCPGPQGPIGPQGPGVAPLCASFISVTTQPTVQIDEDPNSVAITYDSRTIGTINTSGGTYPNSDIVIPTSGTYRVCFSAQCDCTGGTHVIEIFPVINGTSVPDSNTRIRVDAAVETCLTVEYFLSFNANDILQLRMTGDTTVGASNARLLTIASVAGIPSGAPAIPAVPSIILTIQRIE
jgi:hypothetical protein